MPDPDLNFVLRRLDVIQTELRQALRIMEMRDEQREASYQTLLQTLTRQMVSVATAVEDRLHGLEAAMTERFERIEALISAREPR